jgi:hypothetical protein
MNSPLEFAQELETSRPLLSLDGDWAFSYDPRDMGEKEGWFSPDARFSETCLVPGCDQAAPHSSSGITEPEFRKAIPGHFMSELKYPCAAPAWHQKRFSLPADWHDREIRLHFGGINPAADIWLNGVKLGRTLSSRTPVCCSISDLARFGGENVVTVKTFWPSCPRLDGLFEMMYAFSGLYRSVRVEAAPRLHVREVQIVGQIHPPAATINVWSAGIPSGPSGIRIRCDISDMTGKILFSQEMPFSTRQSDSEPQSLSVAMPAARLWEPEAPTLYHAAVTLLQTGTAIDQATIRFGLREIRCEGLRVILNDRAIFLRGGCDDQPYPETISPPTSKAFYIERLKKSLKYGFNYTKSCMEIFVPEYLDAADEVGLLVCQEMPFGLTGDHHNAVYRPMAPERQDLFRQELHHIVRAARNHPSVILYSMASEFYTRQLTDEAFRLFCQELPATTRSLNPTALVMDITCTMGDWTGNEKRGSRNTDIIEDYLPNQERQEPLSHPIAGRYDELNRPFIIHEYNWWSCLSDPAMKSRYDALPTKPTGIPEMEAGAARIGVTRQIPDMVACSRKLKYVLQKCGVEMARRNPKISGYHFWLVAGLSFCQEGVLNEFFEEPSDLTAEEFRMGNADTTLLLDDANRRVFERGRPMPLGIEVSHFGRERLHAPQLAWQLRNGDTILAQNRIAAAPIECGSLSPTYSLAPVVPSDDKPLRLTLHVQLTENGREMAVNRWTLWVVPQPVTGPWAARLSTDLPFLREAHPLMKPLNEQALAASATGSRPTAIVTNHLNETLLDYIEQGGRIVLLSNHTLMDYELNVEWMPGIKSTQGEPAHNNDLYRTVAYNRDSHGNMGTVIANHPVLGGMPHDGWCDLNFRHLISGAHPIVLEYFHPTHIDPIIRSIGHPSTMVDKAYLFEVRVKQGALLATSLRLVDTFDTFPESRFLLDSLLRYAAGDAFSPEAVVSRNALEKAIRK